MRKSLLLLLAAPLVACAVESKTSVTVGRIERLDPAFEKLLAADAKLEKLADGFARGPRARCGIKAA